MTMSLIDEFRKTNKPGGGQLGRGKFVPYDTEITALRNEGYSFRQLARYLEMAGVRAPPAEIWAYFQRKQRRAEKSASKK